MNKEASDFSVAEARRLYRFVWNASAPYQLIACAIAVLTLPLTLAPIELQRRMIDNAIADEDLTLLLILASVYAGVVILQQIAKFLYNFQRGRISERLCQKMRDRIIATPGEGRAPKRKGRKSDEEDDSKDGAVVSMLTHEVEPVGGFGGDAYAQLVTEGGVLITIFGYMFYTEFYLALVALAAFIPQAFATPLVQDMINARAARRIEEVRAIGGDVMKSNHGDRGAKKTALKRTRIIHHLRLIIYGLKYALKAALNLLDHIADLVVLAAGGYMVIIGQTEIGVVVAFLSGLQRLRSPWRTLISYFRVSSDAQMRFSLLSRRFDFLRPAQAPSV